MTVTFFFCSCAPTGVSGSLILETILLVHNVYAHDLGWQTKGCGVKSHRMKKKFSTSFISHLFCSSITWARDGAVTFEHCHTIGERVGGLSLCVCVASSHCNVLVASNRRFARWGSYIAVRVTDECWLDIRLMCGSCAFRSRNGTRLWVQFHMLCCRLVSFL